MRYLRNLWWTVKKTVVDWYKLERERRDVIKKLEIDSRMGIKFDALKQAHEKYLLLRTECPNCGKKMPY